MLHDGWQRGPALCCALALLGLAALSVVVPAGGSRAHTAASTVINTDDGGPGSLRQAIADAPPEATIGFALRYPATITLTSGELVISKPLTITGPGPGLLAVSGNGSSRVFRVGAPSEAEPIHVTLSGLTIRDGNPGLEPGGGLSNGNSDLALFDAVLTGNEACSGGGMSNGGKASLNDVAFVGNAALCNNAGNGGGLSNGSDGLRLTDVVFAGNYSDEYGGGMSNYGSSPTLENVTFGDNSARLEGGGMRIGYGSRPTLTHVVFLSNSARFGGGLSAYVDSHPLLVDVTFDENWAEEGGGMSCVNSSPTLRDVLFRGNSATDGLYGGKGGGMRCGNDTTLTDVTFLNNTARMGGGMHAGSGSPTLTRVLLEGNQAENGGGGLHTDGGSPTLVEVTFSDNGASYGGGMSSFGGTPSLVGVAFRGNLAAGIVSMGGGLYSYGSSPALTNVVMQGNRAESGGGGLCNRGSSAPTLSNVTISGNAAPQGGGMYNGDGSHAAIQNSILWANQALSGSHQIYNENSTPTIAYSDVEGSGGSGAGWDAGLGSDLGGNLDEDPRFVVAVDPADAPTGTGKLRLWPRSPASDAGDNSLVPAGVTTDLDGLPRIVNGIVDLGAYEVQPYTLSYLPLITQGGCPGNVMINGGFEGGAEGWQTYTTGTNWKEHELIGSDAEGFHPYAGRYAARLGGYEGVTDRVWQTVTIPERGQLSYWWQMGTYETLPFHDHFHVELLDMEGNLVAGLASHSDQDVEGVWQQDVLDVSAYGGQRLVLRFTAYNDNYYFSWFDVDEVCLRSRQ